MSNLGCSFRKAKTAPYPFAVQALLLAGVLTGVLSILVGFGGIARLNSATMAAKNRLSLGCYREMAVLIHARLTLDGNFGAMERYRGHIEAIEKEMAEVHDIVKGVHKPPMAHELPLKEYEEEELTKALVEIEACFEEMGLHRSAAPQEVESAVAFEPMVYGDDIEQIYTHIDDLSSTWNKFRAPAWAGFLLAGVFVAASFVELNVALFSVSPYHFALNTGNVWLLFGGLIPLFIGLVVSGSVGFATQVEGLPSRGATTVDFAALDWIGLWWLLARGYDAMMVGHDEHGSPLYELNRVVHDSGGGDGGGGGCGGGGCGGGGCGGGGGF